MTLFSRFKEFINSLPIGQVYTTDELYHKVGCFENQTWWKRSNRQRMYRTSTYQTYLKRLGALENVSRGKWKVLHHIPSWFYCKHVNYLLGYADNKGTTDASECSSQRIEDRVFIPTDQRHNPFKSKSSANTVDAKLTSTEFEKELVNLYMRCDSKSQMELIDKFPNLKNAIDALKYKDQDICELGYELKITTDTWTGPLMINYGIFDPLALKAFIVSCRYEPIIEEIGERTFIYFKLKK